MWTCFFYIPNFTSVLCSCYDKKNMSHPRLDKNSIIGFDLDGVIIDHTALKQHLAELAGFKLEKWQTAAETIQHLIPAGLLEEIQEILYDHFQKSLLAPLMPGAKGALARVVQWNCPYSLISRRHIPQLAEQLLVKHGLWPKYFNAKNVLFVDTKKDKNIEAKRLGVTHYVDDEISVLDEMPAVANRILFDPHGVLSSRRHSYVVVSSWKELLSILR